MLLLLATACGLLGPSDSGEPAVPDDTAPPAETAVPEDTGPVDADGDGYDAGTDCDDARPEVHPGADEVCDGLDNDCDGDADEADPDLLDPITSWRDDDADGYGDSGAETLACAIGRGYAGQSGDCDDHEATIHPGAEESCDGRDEDCDQGIDEGLPINGIWYADSDGDGYGRGDAPAAACAAPPDAAERSGDCDDDDPAVWPEAGDVAGDGRDSDCDGLDCQADAIGGGYFALCLDDAAWHDARAICQAAGYDDLASVQSAEEQLAFEALLDAAGGWASDAPWIGYADELVEGSWGWAGGAKADYTNWAEDEPNGDVVENCAQLNFPLETGAWNDADCGEDGPETGMICEAR